MKKPFFCMLLTLCMALAFLPAIGMAETVNNETDLRSAVNAGGTVTLGADIAITSTLKINGTVTLDLNGHVLSMTGSNSVIEITSSGNLTLTDDNPTATHTGTSLPVGGVITGGNAINGSGGGVYVCSEGKFTMEGGTITNCGTNYSGGGVFNAGTFTMEGGTISDCWANHSGGGVFNDGTFTMEGGTISGCSAFNIGGVRNYGQLQNNSTTGATICYGELDNCGSIKGKLVEFYNGDDLYAWEIVPENTKAVKPSDPQKSGFVLEGWYREETFEHKWNFATDPVEDNMRLYANMIPAPKTANLPQTGDSSHGALWLALLMVSGGALAGAAACGRRKKASAK